MPEFVVEGGRVVSAIYTDPSPSFPHLIVVTKTEIQMFHSTIPNATYAFQHFVKKAGTGYSLIYPCRWDYHSHLTGHVRIVMDTVYRDLQLSLAAGQSSS